jgi:tRNA(Arg) A34 adenosine deaminase TadA
MKSYLDFAAGVAKGGAERNYRLGCVAKRADGALVTSRNERTKTPNPAAHAEVRALKKAGKNATLWVARVTNDGEWTFAKPCPRCQAYIISKEVYKVYYTISPGHFGIWYPDKGKMPDYKKTKYCNHTVWEEA